MKQSDFKARYQQANARTGAVTKMVVAVKLPTGATELIINSEQIESKFEYYLSAYDDEMRLKNNSSIEIVDCLFA